VTTAHEADQRKKAKREFVAWEKANLTAPKEPKSKNPPLTGVEVEEVLDGDLSKVVPRIAALSSAIDDDAKPDLSAREKLEQVREGELAGKARSGVIEIIDRELGSSRDSYY